MPATSCFQLSVSTQGVHLVLSLGSAHLQLPSDDRCMLSASLEALQHTVWRSAGSKHAKRHSTHKPHHLTCTNRSVKTLMTRDIPPALAGDGAPWTTTRSSACFSSPEHSQGIMTSSERACECVQRCYVERVVAGRACCMLRRPFAHGSAALGLPT